MSRINFRQVAEEDLSYAVLSHEVIDFGYITRNDVESFRRFLIDKGFLKKIKNYKNYKVMISFCYNSPKKTKRDRNLYVVNLHKENTYIDYSMQGTELLEFDCHLPINSD